jgi:hypothetical protein
MQEGEGKHFSFEKKTQKTFASWLLPPFRDDCVHKDL